MQYTLCGIHTHIHKRSVPFLVLCYMLTGFLSFWGIHVFSKLKDGAYEMSVQVAAAAGCTCYSSQVYTCVVTVIFHFCVSKYFVWLEKIQRVLMKLYLMKNTHDMSPPITRHHLQRMHAVSGQVWGQISIHMHSNGFFTKSSLATCK